MLTTKRGNGLLGNIPQISPEYEYGAFHPLPPPLLLLPKELKDKGLAGSTILARLKREHIYIYTPQKYFFSSCSCDSTIDNGWVIWEDKAALPALSITLAGSGGACAIADITTKWEKATDTNKSLELHL